MVLKKAGRKVDKLVVMDVDVVEAARLSESLVINLIDAVVRIVKKLQLREVRKHTGTDVPEVVVVEPKLPDGGANRLKVVTGDPGDVVVAEVNRLNTGIRVPHRTVQLEEGNAVVTGINGEGGESPHLVKSIQVQVLHLIEGQIQVAQMWHVLECLIAQRADVVSFQIQVFQLLQVREAGSFNVGDMVVIQVQVLEVLVVMEGGGFNLLDGVEGELDGFKIRVKLALEVVASQFFDLVVLHVEGAEAAHVAETFSTDGGECIVTQVQFTQVNEVLHGLRRQLAHGQARAEPQLF